MATPTTTSIGTYTKIITLSQSTFVEMKDAVKNAVTGLTIPSGTTYSNGGPTGWDLVWEGKYDSLSPHWTQVFRALNVDGVTYKCAIFNWNIPNNELNVTTCERFGTLADFTASTLSAASSTAITNPAWTFYDCATIGWKLDLCDLVLNVHPRWLLAHAYINSEPCLWAGVFELQRTDPMDTATQSNPCWGWIGSTLWNLGIVSETLTTLDGANTSLNGSNEHLLLSMPSVLKSTGRFTGISAAIGFSASYGVTQHPSWVHTQYSKQICTFSGLIGNTNAKFQNVGRSTLYTGTTTDSYESSVSLLLSTGNGTDGANVFIDRSQYNLPITTYGNTVVSSTQYKSGTSSIYFNGTNSYLYGAHTTGLDLSGDFTIEFWLYPVTWGGSCGVVGQKVNDSSAGWQIYCDSGYPTKINARLSAQNNFTSATSVALNTWTHWALVRSGSTVKWYCNGVLDATITNSNNTTTSTDQWYVGYSQTWGGYYNGYIDDLRITKGVARYTANFTPSTTGFNTSYAGTTKAVLPITPISDYKSNGPVQLGQIYGLKILSPVGQNMNKISLKAGADGFFNAGATSKDHYILNIHHKVYITNRINSPDITRTIQGSFPTGYQPTGEIISTGGAYFVLTRVSYRVYKVDATTGTTTMVWDITAAGYTPYCMRFDGERYVYVGHSSGIAKIDVYSLTVTAQITTTPARGIGFLNDYLIFGSGSTIQTAAQAIQKLQISTTTQTAFGTTAASSYSVWYGSVDTDFYGNVTVTGNTNNSYWSSTSYNFPFHIFNSAGTLRSSPTIMSGTYFGGSAVRMISDKHALIVLNYGNATWGSGATSYYIVYNITDLATISSGTGNTPFHDQQAMYMPPIIFKHSGNMYYYSRYYNTNGYSIHSMLTSSNATGSYTYVAGYTLGAGDLNLTDAMYTAICTDGARLITGSGTNAAPTLRITTRWNSETTYNNVKLAQVAILS